MPIYDGVVILAEDDIPVIVEIDDNLVRLSASGTEIGQWAKNECEIRHLGNTTYAIEAEEESLSFVPNQPTLFAAALNHAPSPDGKTPTTESPVGESSRSSADGISEAPPPKPLTMGFFYALCVLTAVLAVWALASIVF